MKNITLSMEESLLKSAREYSRRHNMSLNVLIRRLLEQAVLRENQDWLDETFSLMVKANVNSGGEVWNREDLYRV